MGTDYDPETVWEWQAAQERDLASCSIWIVGRSGLSLCLSGELLGADGSGILAHLHQGRAGLGQR